MAKYKITGENSDQVRLVNDDGSVTVFSKGSWQANRKLLPGGASSFSGSAFKGSRVAKEQLLTRAPNVR